MALAFIREKPPDVEWNVELSFCSCGLPLPDLIEDKLLSTVTEKAAPDDLMTCPDDLMT